RGSLAQAAQVFTQIRFCSPEGNLNFKIKEAPENYASNLTPWFSLLPPEYASYVFIFGHWASLGLKIEPGIRALDTGCVWGRQLTALRLEDTTLFQVDCSDLQFKDTRG